MNLLFLPFLDPQIRFTYLLFFHGLLDSYSINLTHLIPNYVLQVVIFIHLCETFLEITPHFGLWKYLYHYKLGMAHGQHQVVGGQFGTSSR